VGAWQAMTRVLAHEMMNSLTPIASMAESVESLVAAGDFAPQIANAVTTIGRRSRHLMDFVERYRAIVDLPRPVLEEVRTADFFREIEQLIRPELTKRGISFDVSVLSDGVARLDRALVEQAVINLIKNAREAVDQVAEPRVALTGVHEANMLIIQVKDNGRGIEEDLLEEIFVPFFTTKLGGAGVGLALTRQIALAHGGGLTASHIDPAGSMFELRLPT
jgi:signal transduction histidine kinase